MYVGVDLAWGLRKPTGVAAVDATGRLLDVGALRTDDEIIDWARPHVEGPCLVAFDAPIVVANPTGRRPGEALLNKKYARSHAGAHPSNLTRPHFRDGTRALRLATALGLDHLGGSSTQQAIEVYPHPAMVVLFGLDRIIRYKQKPGRDVASLRSALLQVIRHVEELNGADRRRSRAGAGVGSTSPRPRPRPRARPSCVGSRTQSSP